VILWLWAMWKAASGDAWRIPLASQLADRLAAVRLGGGSHDANRPESDSLAADDVRR
jgi:hypothetical protein